MPDTILYDNLGQPITSESATLSNGGIDAFNFTTGSATGTLSDVKLVLVDGTPADMGSVLVRLYTQKGSSPFIEPDALVATLGIVDDSTLSLSTTPTDIPITSTITLAPNTHYFVEAIGILGSGAALASEANDSGTGTSDASGGRTYTKSGSITNYNPNSFGAYVAQVSENTTCYASGTRIRTIRGDVAVEHLAIGDLAITASGEARPISWLGHRTVDCRRHPRPEEVMPVSIAAHAFGEGRPARDLFVSPGHSICVDVMGGLLIPAGALVNGTTIVQVEVETVTYWHVELDTHEIILAENLPAESYLEMGNRGFFAESDLVALATIPDAKVVTHADFCRPFHANGPAVEAVRARLAAKTEQVTRRARAA